MANNFGRFLAASLESEDSVILEKQAAPVPEGIDLGESKSGLNDMIDELNEHVDELSAVESIIAALESHPGAFSQTDAQLFLLAASRTKVKLQHGKLGFGMEAYSGKRQYGLREIALEDFKSRWHAIVEWIIKKIQQIKDYLKRIFSLRKQKLLTVQKLFKNYNPGQHHDFSITHVQTAVNWLSPDGRFAPDALNKNLDTLIKGIVDPGYQQRVLQLGSTIKEIVSKITDKEENFRRHVESVTHLEFPVPPGFHEESASKAEAIYASLPVPYLIRFQGTKAANVAGNRGAKEMAEALAAVRMEEKGGRLAYNSEGSHALSQYGRRNFEAKLHQVAQTLDEAISACSAVDVYGRDLEALGLEAQKIYKEAGPEISSDVGVIAMGLARGAVNVSALVSKISNEILEAVETFARFYYIGMTSL